MAKSVLEKYQQILESDPGSLAFIELAKALIEHGDTAQAADICRRGIEFHPDSVLGRVLWGKALIAGGRPADAMEQFEQAIAIDFENPYAYNLVGEALLQKGLHRSALPILKKAASLQPGDARVRQWLSQARQGAEGPDPSPEAAPPPAATPPRPLTEAPQEHSAFDFDATIPDIPALTGAGPGPAGAAALAATSEPEVPRDLEPTPIVPVPIALVASISGRHAAVPPPAPDLLPVPVPALAEPAATRPSADSNAAEPVPDPPKAAASASAAPSVSPRDESTFQTLPPMPPPLRLPPKPPPKLPLKPPPRPPRLLAELPSMPPQASVPGQGPSVVIAPEAAADIAQAYERELREKLLRGPPPTFWRRNRLKLVAAFVAAAGIGALFFSYRMHRERNRGNDLITFRSQAYGALALDTPRGYRDAIEASSRALALSADDSESMAAQAFAQATLFHGGGRELARAAAAQKLLEATRGKHPAFALGIDLLLADEPRAIESARAAIAAALKDRGASLFGSAPPIEAAQLLSAAGRLALRDGRAKEALQDFKDALDREPRHIATLCALGSYYLAQSEPEEALKWFRAARAASPEHLLALLGIVDAQLALGADPGADLTRAKELFNAANAGWAPGLKGSLDLAEGRALALQGRIADAVNLLDAGANAYRERSADFLSALGQAQALAGDHAKAEAAFAKALDRRPKDAGLREDLARALIAQGRAADALRRLEGIKSGAENRTLHIVRGLARLELGQHQKAREELASTQRNGKVPTEAAVYLAMVDLAQGQVETARAVLESAAKLSKGRGSAQVALGRLALEQGRDEKAAEAFKAAEADRRDWEGACSLGRLELKAGRAAEAKKHLRIALDRNRQHVEARLAMGEALLALGELAPARVELEAVVAQAALPQMAVPISSAATARRRLSRVCLAQGELAAARRHLAEAGRMEPRNPEVALLSAQLAMAAGNTAEGLRALERAARASPNEPSAFCELGEAHLKLGNAAAARTAFQAALKLDPTHLRARLGMVASALPQGASGVARESEDLVRATRGTALRARALALSARVHLAQGQIKSGAERARQAVAADDGSADAHLAMALAASSGKPRDDRLAISELMRVVAADPVIAEAHLALADSLARDEQGDRARAIAELETYLRIAPKGPSAESAKKALARLRKKGQE
jgi:tetratricopeptide (TPR) repeat protein